MPNQHSQYDNAHRYTPSRSTKTVKLQMHLHPNNHNLSSCFTTLHFHQTIRHNATMPDTQATPKLVFDINSTDTRQPDTATGCQSKPS